MNTKHIKAILATLMLTVLCASAYVSVPTITNGIGFQYGNVTVGSDNIQICGANVTKTATVVVAASDSLHQGLADYVCDGVDDQNTVAEAMARMAKRIDLFDEIEISTNIPYSYGSAWYDGTIYHAFMPSNGNVNHWTSTDGGATWVEDTTHNPILSGDAGQWDQLIEVTKTWKENSTWYMLYRGNDGSDNRCIGLATSSDAITWTKESTNPVIEPTEDWECVSLDPVGIIKIGDTYYLWINNVCGISRLSGLATSTDLITWTKDERNPIFEGNRFCGDIFKQGSYYYLLIPHWSGVRGGFEELELWRSTTPEFYPEDRDYMGVAIHGDEYLFPSTPNIDTPSIITTTIQRDVLVNDQIKIFYTYKQGYWKMAVGSVSNIPTETGWMGGDIVLLPGTYKFEWRLPTRENVRILGYGATIESYISSGTPLGVLYPEQHSTIEGVKIIRKDSGTNDVYGIYPGYANYIDVKNVNIIGFTYGIRATSYNRILRSRFYSNEYGVYIQDEYNIIDSCRFYANTRGVMTRSGKQGNLIKDSYFQQTHHPALNIFGDYDTILHNICIGGENSPIYVVGDYTTLKENIVIEPCVDFFALAILGDHAIVDGNYLESANIDGTIRLNGAKYSNIINNCIVGRASGTNYAQISLREYDGDDASLNTIKGNYIITANSYGIMEKSASCNNNHIVDNTIIGATHAGVYLQGDDSIAVRNIGFTTENSGTATLATGTTSIAVNHGLDVTPAAGDIVVTPIETWGNMTKFWIGNYTSTQFTIYADQNPGQDVDFAWKAIVL